MKKNGLDTMKMEQRTFRIGELAQHLGIERFVIRFWEKEFNLYPERSQGGQRHYTDLDMQKFLLIKQLLYQKGLTIPGAKKALQAQQSKKIDFISQLLVLRSRLINFKKNLLSTT